MADGDAGRPLLRDLAQALVRVQHQRPILLHQALDNFEANFESDSPKRFNQRIVFSLVDNLVMDGRRSEAAARAVVERAEVASAFFTIGAVLRIVSTRTVTAPLADQRLVL